LRAIARHTSSVADETRHRPPFFRAHNAIVGLIGGRVPPVDEDGIALIALAGDVSGLGQRRSGRQQT